MIEGWEVGRRNQDLPGKEQIIPWAQYKESLIKISVNAITQAKHMAVVTERKHYKILLGQI